MAVNTGLARLRRLQLEYRNMDKRLYSANDPSTSCTNMLTFGPVTPETEVWEICTFEMTRQKAAYLTEYLNNYWTDFHEHFSFGRCMHGDYNTYIFVLYIVALEYNYCKSSFYGKWLFLYHWTQYFVLHQMVFFIVFK